LDLLVARRRPLAARNDLSIAVFSKRIKSTVPDGFIVRRVAGGCDPRKHHRDGAKGKHWNAGTDNETHDAGAFRLPPQNRHLVGTVIAYSGGQELPRLQLGGASGQVGGDEIDRLVHIAVDAGIQPLADNLAHPRIEIAGTVDPVTVELIGEAAIDISMRRCGQRNGESDDPNDSGSLHRLNLGLVKTVWLNPVSREVNALPSPATHITDPRRVDSRRD